MARYISQMFARSIARNYGRPRMLEQGEGRLFVHGHKAVGSMDHTAGGISWLRALALELWQIKPCDLG